MGIQMPITIEKVVQGVNSNKYVLPAIQREFVWDAEQIEKLFDSLLRGYPIGTFLFWKIDPNQLKQFQFYRFMDHYHERDYYRNEPIKLLQGNDAIAVLDGQQRITALYIGLNGWYAYKMPYYPWDNERAFPERRLYLNLREPSQEVDFEYEFKMLRDSDLEDNDDKYWFRVGDVLKFKSIPDVFNFCVNEGLVQKGFTYPSDTLIKLWKMVKEDGNINYFLEEEQDLDRVLNIFIRVNSGGTILKYSDMLLSIATAQWKDADAREEVYGLVDRLNETGEGFSFDKDFVLKTSLVLTDIPGIEFRVNNFNHVNMKKIEKAWSDIKKALTVTVGLLQSWGFSGQTLVSNYAIIPLVYFIYQKGHSSSFISAAKYKTDREKMLRFVRTAILKRTFSGTPDNVLRSIRKVIQQNLDGFPLDQIAEELKTTAKTLSFNQDELDGLLGYHYGQSYTFVVLSMLYPWLKFDQQFHVDHIFPKSMFTPKVLKKHHIPENEWWMWLDQKNHIGNLQLLQGLPNIDKSDNDFEAWLKGECPTPKDLSHYRKSHLIPNVDLAFTNFPEFLEEREKLIRDCLAEMLGIE